MNSYINVGIPTRDSRAVIQSISTIIETALFLKRDIKWRVSQSGFIILGRNDILKQVKTEFPEKTHDWILWLDDDIIITEDYRRLSYLITEAEKRNLSWGTNVKIFVNTKPGEQAVSNYIQPPGGGKSYSEEELFGAKDFELKVARSGLALGYIYTPLDYKFHWTEAGEDINFFLENKEIDLRYCRLRNLHQKSILI
jgi:hypothetical protein